MSIATPCNAVILTNNQCIGHALILAVVRAMPVCPHRLARIMAICCNSIRLHCTGFLNPVLHIELVAAGILPNLLLAMMLVELIISECFTRSTKSEADSSRCNARNRKQRSGNQNDSDQFFRKFFSFLIENCFY